MRDIWFYTSIGSFILGVALHSFFSFSFFAILTVLFVGLSLSFYFKVFAKLPFGSFQVLLSISILMFAFGLLRFNLSEPPNLMLLEKSVEQTITLTGTVLSEPDVREKVTLVTVTIEEPIQTKILITVEKYPEYQYGDVISFTGNLEKPKTFETDTGKIVNYPAYLAKDGIYYTLFRPDIEILDRGQGNAVREKLFSLKKFFLHSVEKVIFPPESSLLAGLLLGENSLPKNLSDLFRVAGIIHIVVLSGFNITIVARMVMWLFSAFPRRGKFIAGTITIVLFAVMTGGSATVIRASIMALLYIFAQATYRIYAITRALIFAGLLMVVHNPKILIFDFGFQLSFLATLGLVLLSPIIEKHLLFVPKLWGFREIVVATFATQIFVLPLLLFATGQFSVVSLFTNLLVLTLVPATMLVGFSAGLLAMLNGAVALPAGFVAYLLLHYEIWVAEFFGSLPWASLSVPNFPLWAMVLLYAVFGLFLVVFYRREGAAKNLTK